jgi:hypothetical protein
MGSFVKDKDVTPRLQSYALGLIVSISTATNPTSRHMYTLIVITCRLNSGLTLFSWPGTWGFRQRILELLKEWSWNINKSCRRNGMGILTLTADERVKNVSFTDDSICVDLMDGRLICVPLLWYPRLYQAPPAQLADWQVSGGGYGIHWPDIDEDLSTEGLLRGAPAPGQRKAAVA